MMMSRCVSASMSSTWRIFSYKELHAATNGFSEENKLGEGGFGSVYKGFVRAADGKGDRIPVAVKKLNQRGLQVRTCSAWLLVLSPLVALSPRACACHLRL